MSIITQINCDYLLVKKMQANEAVKKRILTELFSQGSNPWRVVGITENALKIFKKKNYKRESKMDINRSHIFSRNDTYDSILNEDFKSPEDFWNFYYSRDFTIFATTSENKTNLYSDIYFFGNSKNLFNSRGYAWVHNNAECDFLRQIKSNSNIKTIEEIKKIMSAVNSKT